MAQSCAKVLLPLCVRMKHVLVCVWQHMTIAGMAFLNMVTEPLSIPMQALVFTCLPDSEGGCPRTASCWRETVLEVVQCGRHGRYSCSSIRLGAWRWWWQWFVHGMEKVSA